jgi:CTD small phosphatase-like protein 2
MATGATIVEQQPIISIVMQQNNNNVVSATTPPPEDGGGGNGVARTPQRTNANSSSSNLAHDPITTPIASAKRPRGSTTTTGGSTSSTTTTTPSEPPSSSSRRGGGGNISYTSVEVTLSPMHAIKPVHREALEDEIKDIFSPVAHFLHEAEHHHSTSNYKEEDEDDENVDDNDEEEEASIDQESIAQPHVADDDEFNPWTFIQTLPPYETLQPNPVALPPARDATKKCLVLDLDETLVHCSVDAPAQGSGPADLTFPVVFHGNHYTVHVKLRPWLTPFLESVSTKFEVIVFTASQKVYADALLNLIDPGTFFVYSFDGVGGGWMDVAFVAAIIHHTSQIPHHHNVNVFSPCTHAHLNPRTEGKYIHHRLFRESCLQVEGNFLKDLNVLGRPLEKTLLVDNSPHAFGYQVDNGIPIESWFEDPNDRELRKLEKFLVRQILDEPDVRPIIRRKFQSGKLVRDS